MKGANRQAPGNILSPWRARAALIGVFTLFFVPLLAAWWLNMYAPRWQPFGYINRGDLVVPAIRVQATGLKALDGQSLGADFLTDRWTLVYASAGECQASCEKALRHMRQIRLALGKNRDRVQRLLIATSNNSQGRYRTVQLLTQFPRMRIATTRAGSQFNVPAIDANSAIMLIDPRSFLIMRFSTALPAKDILKDMQRLLKLAKHD